MTPQKLATRARSFFLQRVVAAARDCRGATSLEYAIIAAGISIVIILGAIAIGDSVNALFGQVNAVY